MISFAQMMERLGLSREHLNRLCEENFGFLKMKSALEEYDTIITIGEESITIGGGVTRCWYFEDEDQVRVLLSLMIREREDAERRAKEALEVSEVKQTAKKPKTRKPKKKSSDSVVNPPRTFERNKSSLKFITIDDHEKISSDEDELDSFVISLLSPHSQSQRCRYEGRYPSRRKQIEDQGYEY